MRRPTVLLGDDHEIVIEGLLGILESDFEVVGSVNDGAALIKAAEKLKPELIITDISMPVLNGIEAIRRINKSLPRTAIVVLTMHLDVMYAAEAIAAGATGYVLKHSIRSELLKAAHKVLKRKVYVSKKIVPEVMQALAEASRRNKSVTIELTARQREVLQLVAEGRKIREIAQTLYISPRTVEFHKYNIMEALGLHSTAELTQYAMKRGIVAV